MNDDPTEDHHSGETIAIFNGDETIGPWLC